MGVLGYNLTNDVSFSSHLNSMKMPQERMRNQVRKVQNIAENAPTALNILDNSQLWDMDSEKGGDDYLG